MSESIPRAKHCNNMAEVRQHIDALDERIVARVKAQAARLGAPPEILEATYRAMIDASIVYEQRTFDKIHAAQNQAGVSA